MHPDYERTFYRGLNQNDLCKNGAPTLKTDRGIQESKNRGRGKFSVCYARSRPRPLTKQRYDDRRLRNDEKHIF